jgi:hypothetical protein
MPSTAAIRCSSWARPRASSSTPATCGSSTAPRPRRRHRTRRHWTPPIETAPPRPARARPARGLPLPARAGLPRRVESGRGPLRRGGPRDGHPRALGRALPERRALRREAAPLLLDHRLLWLDHGRAGRDRRPSPLGPLRHRLPAARLSDWRAPVRPPRRMAGGRGFRHLLQDPLAGAVRADRHDAHRAGDPRRLVLGAGLDRGEAPPPSPLLPLRRARHPGQGSRGAPAASAVDGVLPAPHPEHRGAQADADRLGAPPLGRGGARLADPGRARRGTRLPAADRLPAERHPLRRSLAPLRTLVLLSDHRAG